MKTALKDIPLSTLIELDAQSAAITIDGIKSDLSVQHISEDEYHQLVKTGTTLSNMLYVVSSDYINAYEERLVNLSDGVDLLDAVNVKQLSAVSAAVPEKLLASDAWLSGIYSALSSRISALVEQIIASHA